MRSARERAFHPDAEFVSEECEGGGTVAASVSEMKCREVPGGHAGVSGVIGEGGEAWMGQWRGSVSIGKQECCRV